MIVKFQCGQTILYSKKNDFKIIPAAGVGNLKFLPCDSIWTGYCHLSPDFDTTTTLSVHVSNITSIKTRSSLDEDDEEWKILFQREDRPFSYEYENDLENLITEINT